MRSYLAPLLVVFLLAGCQSGTPKQASVPPVVQNKIFRSDKFGFSFSYPAQWHINEESDNRALMGLDYVFNTGDPDAHEGVSIDDIGRKTLRSRLLSLDKPRILSMKEIPVGGEPGQVVVENTGYSYVFVKHGTLLYEFQTKGILLENGVIASVKFFSASSSS